jgi:hypothetical protein
MNQTRSLSDFQNVTWKLQSETNGTARRQMHPYEPRASASDAASAQHQPGNANLQIGSAMTC